VTYTAVYTESARRYTVTFANYDGTILQQSEVEYGKLPEYTGDTPTKPSSQSTDYTFSGWTPELKEVTGEATYTAVYTESARKYTVTFLNWDGEVLQSADCDSGTMPSYTGETPIKPNDSQYSYIFSGWTPEIVEVTGDATYTAVYEIDKYLVTGITLDQTEVALPVDGTMQLTYTIEPTNADNQNVTWSSSDPAVATADETGLITAKRAGKAVITVTTEDGGFTASCAVTVQFSDVTDDTQFYYDYIYRLVEAGIISGYSDGTFRPMNDCNRAAVVTFLWRSAGRPEPTEMASFSDMTGNEEFDKAISWAVEQGITNGWSDNTFRPWRTCNRAAVMTFLWRMAGSPEPAKMATFTDMTGNEEFDKAISWAVEKGITTGWNNNTFRPWRTCNRLAIVSFIARYLGYDD
ncbi:MAG: S-layer homology domain-containing protein, partial [Lachnospiraceae bacterium]|nr:S-layer homology domain-containing protein [Lachnospiraceae bacterium]